MAIRFDPGYRGVAYVKNAGVGHRIHVGHAFLVLAHRQKIAVLLHEVGHIKRRHILRRVLNFWRLRKAFALLCARQELEADAFAAEHGYGRDLLQVLRAIGGSGQPLRDARIARLEGTLPP